MRKIIYIISLFIVLFFGLSAHASSVKAYLPWSEISNLYHINYANDDDLRTVMVRPDTNPKKICVCVCQPAYDGSGKDSWACTQSKCSYQDKKCEPNFEDYK